MSKAMGVRGPLLLVTILIVLVSGCRRPNEVTFSVAEQDFVVPRKYLVEDRLPWLPDTDVPGFIFVLNPEDRIEARIYVLVESRNSYCSSPTEAVEKEELCKNGLISYPSHVPKNLIKVPTEYKSFWSYGVDGINRPNIVARCHEVSTSASYGSCSSAGIHHGLYYEFGFNELRINELRGLHEQVRTLLGGWSR